MQKLARMRLSTSTALHCTALKWRRSYEVEPCICKERTAADMQTRAGILEKSLPIQSIYAWLYLILGEGTGKRGRETK